MSEILSIPFAEDDDKLSYKMEIRRLEKERREWKSLAQDRHKRMKLLNKKIQALQGEQDE